MCTINIRLPSKLNSVQESGYPIMDEPRSKFVDLHKILQALRAADIGPALEYVNYSKMNSYLINTSVQLDAQSSRLPTRATIPA